MPAKPDAKKLLDSLDLEQGFPISQEWPEEIRRRCDEIDSGKTTMLDGAMVINELCEQYTR